MGTRRVLTGSVGSLVLTWMVVGMAAGSVAAETAVPRDGHGGIGECAIDEETIDEIVVVTPHERVGYVQATFTFDLPAGVDGVTLRVPPSFELIDAGGFERLDAFSFEWKRTEGIGRPTMTVLVEANYTVDGQYRFVDTGEWAIVRTPTVWTDYSGTDAPVQTCTTVDGRGVAGSSLTYLGPHEVFTVETTAGETVRLVVPAAASLGPGNRNAPERLLAAFADASRALDVGAVDEEVLVVAGPWNALDWELVGFQRGQSDVFVSDATGLGRPDPTWLHEYVHTRQDFHTANDARWLREAIAEYYAVLLNYEADRTTYRAVREHFARGRTDRWGSAVLADRSTWEGTGAAYATGALVLARIDFASRNATGGERTFQDVFRRMNGFDGPIDHDAFVGLVRDVGGERPASLAAEYATSTARPALWDESTHDRVFGTTEPNVDYRMADARFAIGDASAGPPHDETAFLRTIGAVVVASVTVENTGTAAGAYAVAILRDGEPVAVERGRLEFGERSIVVVSYTVDKPGQYGVVVGADVAVAGPTTAGRINGSGSPVPQHPSVDRSYGRP